MITPGPERVPSTVNVGKTTGQGKPPTGKTGANRPGGNRPGGKGGKGRKTVTPVKVSGGRNWGPIAVAGVVVLIAIGIVGYGVFASVKGTRPWEEQLAEVSGVVNYRAQKNPQIDARDHKEGPQTYVTNPPVGGAHNQAWQNCMGDVYSAPIANEYAVHSLEHGAVWLTYKQGLGADQVEKLQEKIQGKDFSMMSPIANMDKNVSVQAWGYQLKDDDAGDSRIDDFIRIARAKATMEPGAGCSSGNTSSDPVAPAPAASGATTE